MLPLVLDLPVRFTQEPDANDRVNGVFTNARGWLRGWDLPENEVERVREETAARCAMHARSG